MLLRDLSEWVANVAIINEWRKSNIDVSHWDVETKTLTPELKGLGKLKLIKEFLREIKAKEKKL